ncbi:halocyanin domain-containing protein [Halalkalicoccus tibetensis]|uniref:Halocyanin domain-containing protein n=1 Tax=Halalkalicoccus tibetensis TaxID=175632 RepID=A0ABD5V4M5_9EURY
MQSDPSLDRRTVLRAAGALVAVGGLAGCTDDAGGGGSDEPDYETVPDDEEPDYEGWLDSAETYDGTADYRGEEEVTVLVGTGSQGYSFSPAAIMVDPGTEVVWEWTGQGGGHNVEEEDGEYESPIESEEGHTFEHTFEEPEVSLYTCIPHDQQGMRGAVAVEE